ncbi:unnamed protein product [Pseudo-nitzschia multistriata]|uniref:Propionyl-CoA carboxylase n=1 Tax=Pseudo-nitzschia multistriata TaxID=183589 RepID=A0A448Z9B4_9STRA|nr:unnamed protein product [Pseudo-nitzschia multistriata]
MSTSLLWAARTVSRASLRQRNQLWPLAASAAHPRFREAFPPARSFSAAEGASSPPGDAPPFRKVLIANRGEIAIRVARTCRRLGIPTVAVYASNDTDSSHVSECDEAVCLGTGGVSSYLDTDRIAEAIRSTEADAVHPGYGFLSENAGFAEAVASLGSKGETVAWLGPPPQAIRDMGCKLRSKAIAREAGVAIIPGGESEGALDSLEDALEAMRKSGSSLRYPVLLKAAAGGGGKGMRICYDDRELIEAYPMARSEGLKFFADDRLLLEQYLEEPHHIEFQVVCSKATGNGDGDLNADGHSSNSQIDVAIFAERECSVQRRNQKVVEESPSCLLTEETRRKMMEQTTLLCQSVGYEGAGTVEWLVVGGESNRDQAQDFYFLEMNTRLQVEHPITEAVSGGLDLVEAMLEVGAGRGLPREWYETAEVVEEAGGNGRMLVMPWKGHAIEGRIYAEDPLRGYLPSTGPLLPYMEPPRAVRVSDGGASSSSSWAGTDGVASYLRLDSGVVEGHVVTPFYDPMLSKIISYAPTREEAIDVLSEGLDSYVIEGVNHNARLIQAVLRHPSFQKGDTPTSFLETHIPDFGGYSVRNGENETEDPPSLLTAREEEDLAVAAALIWRERERLLGRPPTGRAVEDENGQGRRDFVVRLDGWAGGWGDGAISVALDEGRTEGLAAGRRLAADPSDQLESFSIAIGPGFSIDFENHLASMTLDGTFRTVQVLGEQPSGELRVQMLGARYEGCLVQSPREYELSRHVLPPVANDTSNTVLSPMPGTLIGFSGGVEEGSFVEEGQELCIVEAMKMQNVVRAPRAGIIARLRVDEGAALVTDQVLMEYEAEEGDEPTAA